MNGTTTILTDRSYKSIKNRRNAMAPGDRGATSPDEQFTAATVEIAESLLLHLPDFSWTIEVDFLGNHRVTVHFKGAEILVDE